MNNDFVQLPPVVKLYDDMIVVYNNPDSIKTRNYNENSLDNLRSKEEYKAVVSSTRKRKIKEIICAWHNCCIVYNRCMPKASQFDRRKIAMLTLTLPAAQVHDDREIKRKIFQPFLQELRRLYGLELYLWRAEPQVNGNIHFHVLLDIYIPYLQLKVLWDKFLNVLGYVSRFKQKNPNKNNPSVNIVGTRTKNNSYRYLFDYACKENGKRKLKGAVWGCSDKLRNLSVYKMEVDASLNALIDYAIAKYRPKELAGDYYTVYLFPKNISVSALFQSCDSLVDTYYHELAHWLYFDNG